MFFGFWIPLSPACPLIVQYTGENKGEQRVKLRSVEGRFVKQEQAVASKVENNGGILQSFVISGSAVQIRPWAPYFNNLRMSDNF